MNQLPSKVSPLKVAGSRWFSGSLVIVPRLKKMVAWWTSRDVYKRVPGPYFICNPRENPFEIKGHL